MIDVTKLFLIPEPAPLLRIDASSQWKHSSKTARLMEEVRNVLNPPTDGSTHDPHIKIIIFSQWTSMLDLVEIPLKQDKFDFLRLDGSLSQKDREQVLKKFSMSTSSARILLISLKAGGVGLNLVMASHCFFIDVWWNPQVEEQACQVCSELSHML